EVTVVTSAAQDGPARPLRWARAYFERLGVQVRGCLIQTRADAADERLVRALAASQAVFLCGGDPAAAREVLVASPAQDVILQLFRAGKPIVGSSAGAMVMAAACLLPGRGFQLQPGLGLLPGAVVVPHWNTAGEECASRARALASEFEVIAIAEMTAACWDGWAWETVGPGGAVVLAGSGTRSVAGSVPSAPIE
ncbi:MAG: Type 1 glutamine amidotransferase-like domain-containing protein, partial [Candidatus Dormibacteria bacterium]